MAGVMGIFRRFGGPGAGNWKKISNFALAIRKSINPYKK